MRHRSAEPLRRRSSRRSRLRRGRTPAPPARDPVATSASLKAHCSVLSSSRTPCPPCVEDCRTRTSTLAHPRARPKSCGRGRAARYSRRSLTSAGPNPQSGLSSGPHVFAIDSACGRVLHPRYGLLYQTTLITPAMQRRSDRYLEASCTYPPCPTHLAYRTVRRGGASRLPSPWRWPSPLSQQAYSPRPASQPPQRRPRPVRGSAPPPPPPSGSKR